MCAHTLIHGRAVCLHEQSYRGWAGEATRCADIALRDAIKATRGVSGCRAPRLGNLKYRPRDRGASNAVYTCRGIKPDNENYHPPPAAPCRAMQMPGRCFVCLAGAAALTVTAVFHPALPTERVILNKVLARSPALRCVCAPESQRMMPCRRRLIEKAEIHIGDLCAEGERRWILG